MSEAAVKTALKPKEIDALIADFAAAQTKVAEAAAVKKTFDAVADELKAKLIAVVQEQGARHTDKSKKLEGVRNSATVTVGTLVSVDAGKVEEFRAYVGKSEVPYVSEHFFTERTTYQLVDGPQDVLKTLELKTPIRKKLEQLLQACFKIGTKTPILKVDVAETAKP